MQSLLKTIPCFTSEQTVNIDVDAGEITALFWATGVNQLPSDVSIRTSTSLKIPRRSSLCLATWALFITWKKTSAVIYGSQIDSLRRPWRLNEKQNYDTYINEIFGMENIRDLIAEQILFGSPQTLDVHMLDNHLWSRMKVTSSPKTYFLLKSATFNQVSDGHILLHDLVIAIVTTLHYELWQSYCILHSVYSSYTCMKWSLVRITTITIIFALLCCTTLSYSYAQHRIIKHKYI